MVVRAQLGNGVAVMANFLEATGSRGKARTKPSSPAARAIAVLG